MHFAPLNLKIWLWAWWAVTPNSLRRNGPECAAAFDHVQSIKSDVTKGLIQVRNLAERGPVATVGDPLANTQKRT